MRLLNTDGRKAREVDQLSKKKISIQIVFNWVWKLRLVKIIGDDGKAFNFYHFLRGFFNFPSAVQMGLGDVIEV
jgi:hypothetical protein